jgi:hypothetical protein
MTKRELAAALAEAERVRDQWCAEYVKVRNKLAKMVAAEKAGEATLKRLGFE